MENPMRTLTTVTTIVALLALAGCGGDTETPAAEPAPTRTSIEIPLGIETPLGKDFGTAPPCPFTAEQATRIAGKPFKQEADGCLFRGPNGVGSITVNTASRGAGETTFEYNREQAEASKNVSDLEAGDLAYLAVGDLDGEAVVINAKGSYTIQISNMSEEPSGYERILRELVAALPQ
jgi:hypothetical protein